MEHRECQKAQWVMSDILEGRAGTDGEARLRLHLRQCATCAQRWESLTVVDTGLRDMAQVPVPPTLLAGVMSRVPKTAPAAAVEPETVGDRILSGISSLGAIAAIVLAAVFVGVGVVDTASLSTDLVVVAGAADLIDGLWTVVLIVGRVGMNGVVVSLGAVRDVMPVVGSFGTMAAIAMGLLLWRVLSRMGGVPVGQGAVDR